MMSKEENGYKISRKLVRSESLIRDTGIFIEHAESVRECACNEASNLRFRPTMEDSTKILNQTQLHSSILTFS